MRIPTTGAAIALNLLAMATAASAASLQVSPVNIEVPSPGTASTVELVNLGKDQINAQVRIFEWKQIDGKDELVPTRDVVASPPALKMTAGKKSVIRIVRTNKAPVQGEETYRLVVDEIPSASKPRETGVNFAVRYSIPVFFNAAGVANDVAWTARIEKGRLRLTAHNSGDRRLRVSSLRATTKSGAAIKISDGLAGYVLGQSSRDWSVKLGGKSVAPGTSIMITAQGDNGPIEATAKVVAGN